MVTINVGDRAASQVALARYIGEFYGYDLELVSMIQACRTGSADDVLAYLREYWEAGARVFVLRLASLDAPEQQLDAVGNAVLPALKLWSD